jgi:hypothetical protein
MSLNKSGVGEFFNQSLSFPRRRESRNVLLKKLDARRSLPLRRQGRA